MKCDQQHMTQLRHSSVALPSVQKSKNNSKSHSSFNSTGSVLSQFHRSMKTADGLFCVCEQLHCFAALLRCGLLGDSKVEKMRRNKNEETGQNCGREVVGFFFKGEINRELEEK